MAASLHATHELNSSTDKVIISSVICTLLSMQVLQNTCSGCNDKLFVIILFTLQC